MRLILDSSLLIADKRGKFDMPGFLRKFPNPQPMIAPKSLYDPKIATMESAASACDQSDAPGFIRLTALRLKPRAILGNRPAGSS
jgi:hypothetical protein